MDGTGEEAAEKTAEEEAKSEAEFVLDRFLADRDYREFGYTEDEDQMDNYVAPVAFTNCIMRGRKKPPLNSLKLPRKAMQEHGVDISKIPGVNASRLTGNARYRSTSERTVVSA